MTRSNTYTHPVNFGVGEEAKEFLSRIAAVYANCAGSENYGDHTEFFDEDGAVLMVVVEHPNGSFDFHFEGTDEVFSYSRVA